MRERAKLGFSGVVSLALAIDKRGDLIGDPDVLISGLPKKRPRRRGHGRGRRRRDLPHLRQSAAAEAARFRRRGDGRRARGAGQRQAVWGKKPQVHVLIIEV